MTKRAELHMSVAGGPSEHGPGRAEYRSGTRLDLDLDYDPKHVRTNFDVSGLVMVNHVERVQEGHGLETRV